MTSALRVIIVNWNGKRHLAPCLDGLRRQTCQDFSVTLVDNGSSDDSVRFCRENYPEVTLISVGENRGFCAANNMAFDPSQGKYTALLNNDTVPHPEWLQKLVEALEEKAEAGLAASKMLFHDRPHVIDRCGDSYTTAGAGKLRGRSQSAQSYARPEWIFGACAGAALYRNVMLQDIGFLDEDFYLLYEDVDLSFRAQLKGYRCIYVPEAIVYHKASSSILRDSPLSVYYGHRNLEWVYIQNMPAKLIPRTIVQHLIYDLACFCYFLLKGRAGAFLRAKRDALLGFKKSLRKRDLVQQGKRVDDQYIWDLLDGERLGMRMAQRLNGKTEAIGVTERGGN